MYDIYIYIYVCLRTYYTHISTCIYMGCVICPPAILHFCNALEPVRKWQTHQINIWKTARKSNFPTAAQMEKTRFRHQCKQEKWPRKDDTQSTTQGQHAEALQAWHRRILRALPVTMAMGHVANTASDIYIKDYASTSDDFSWSLP